MADLVKWKIYCITEQKFQYTWSATQPTTCPVNGADTIGEVVDVGTNSQLIHNATNTINTTFTVVHEFFFGGSNYEPDLSLLRVVCKVEDGTGRIRVYDKTNNQQIAITDTISNTNMQVIVFPSISNIPTLGAIWELQLVKDTGSGKIIVDCLILSF